MKGLPLQTSTVRPGMSPVTRTQPFLGLATIEIDPLSFVIENLSLTLLNRTRKSVGERYRASQYLAGIDSMERGSKIGAMLTLIAPAGFNGSGLVAAHRRSRMSANKQRASGRLGSVPTVVAVARLSHCHQRRGREEGEKKNKFHVGVSSCVGVSRKSECRERGRDRAEWHLLISVCLLPACTCISLCCLTGSWRVELCGKTVGRHSKRPHRDYARDMAMSYNDSKSKSLHRGVAQAPQQRWLPH